MNHLQNKVPIWEVTVVKQKGTVQPISMETIGASYALLKEIMSRL